MKVADASILLHPNIPKPLHGVAPRVIAGKAWWDKNRQAAYANAGYCCEACGVKKQEAKYHKWLEAHEVYEYDYLKGRLTFRRLVALCHSCHNYIHNGRMEILVKQGRMEKSKQLDIIKHGNLVLEKAGLLDNKDTAMQIKEIAKWADWRLVFEGKEYGPSSKSYSEWLAGLWRDWKPLKI